jgi:YD repeat-containing protein
MVLRPQVATLAVLLMTGGATSLRGATQTPQTMPCPPVVGHALLDLGSGACTGNHQTRIPLPLFGTLIHNSIDPFTTEQGFGKGFSWSWSRALVPLANAAGWQVVDGEGTRLALTAIDASTWRYSDIRYGRNKFSQVSPTLIRESDGEGNTSDYKKFSDGIWHVTSTAEQHGRTTTMVRTAAGVLTAVNADFGRTVTFNRPNATTVQIIFPELDGGQSVVTLTLDGGGRLTNVGVPGNQKWSLGYDNAGHVTRSLDYEGRSKSATYADASGILTSITDENTFRTDYTYTANSVTLTDVMQAYTESFTNARLTAATTTSGKATTTVQYTLDTLGRVTKISAPEGETTITYWGDSQYTKDITDPSGVTETTTYDANGDIVQIDRTADGDTQTTTYEYNALHSPTSVRRESTQVTMSYNAAGDLMSTQDGFGRTLMQATYDTVGRPLTSTDELLRTTTFLYNGAYLVRETDELGRQTTYQTTPMGTVVGTMYPNTATRVDTFDFTGRTMSSVLRGPGGAPAVSTLVGITRDANGAPTTISYLDLYNFKLYTIEQRNFIPGAPGRLQNVNVRGLDGNWVTAEGYIDGLLKPVPQWSPTPSLSSQPLALPLP